MLRSQFQQEGQNKQYTKNENVFVKPPPFRAKSAKSRIFLIYEKNGNNRKEIKHAFESRF